MSDATREKISGLVGYLHVGLAQVAAIRASDGTPIQKKIAVATQILNTYSGIASILARVTP